MAVKLDVGCGDQCAAGFVGVDPFWRGAEVEAPASRLPYGDGAVAAIRCTHALEHMTVEEASAALAEFARVLRSGGELYLTVPDSLYIVSYLLAHGGHDEWGRILVWGQGRWPGDAHRTAWALDTLADAVAAAGFVVRSARREWTGLQRQTSIVVEAVKHGEPV